MIKLFQKFAQVEGAQPSSRPQARNFSLAVLFGTFSCGYIAKKKYGENLFNVKNLRLLGFYVSKPFPFFLSKEAQKEPKRPRIVSPLRRRLGALPVDFWMLNFAEIQHRVASLTLERTTTFTRHHPFLKKGRSKTFMRGHPCGGGEGAFCAPQMPKIVRSWSRNSKKSRIQDFFHHKSSQILFTFCKSCAII